MDVTYCAQCGGEIEGKGITFRARIFCGGDDPSPRADDLDDFAIEPDDF